ncbi:MAG: hypothetical protein KDC39_11435 [Actinobacteria bacterium]|nr:hypothetical protein [Actinomycetota bacterium]
MAIERFVKRSPLESSEPVDDVPPVPSTQTMSFGLTTGGPTMVTLPDFEGLPELVAALRRLSERQDEQDRADALAALELLREGIQPES